jgi:hypothetical protein
MWLCLGVLAMVGAADARAAEPGNGKPEKTNYSRPFEPPTRAALIPLPAGTIEPQGWLRDWCLTARDGYTGHMDEVHQAFKQAWAVDYKMTGDKLFWPNGGWPYEGGGYWFDGLVRLGYALHDELLINQAKARLGAVVDNMSDKGISFLWWLDRNDPADLKAAEGRHYSDSYWPLWANGLFGRALAAYCAASNDPRAIRTLETAYCGRPEWLRMSWGMSNAWPAFEAYTWSGRSEIKEALTELFTQPGDDTRKWPWNRYRRMPKEKPGAEPNDHGVHFLESTAPWALGYLWTGDRTMYDAAVAWHDFVGRDSMQPFGVIVSDEHYGPTGAFRSTETCNVAGHVWSNLLLLMVGGQGAMADRIERAVLNAGPATVSRDFKTHVYFQSPNRMADRSLPPTGQCTYRKSHGPLCCTAALNRFLPYYVTHMWMATCDNGLVAAHYGPCRLSALAGEGVPVEIDCRTEYPFGDVIEMTVKPARQVAFPLSLRVPGWCKGATVAVNGAAVPAAPDAKGFVRIERTWNAGDAVRLQFPMAIQVATGLDKNVRPPAPYATVSYGPLLMALPIADTTDANTPDPNAKWKYAIESEGENPGADMTVERGPMPAKWDWPLASPLRVHVRAAAFDWNPLPKQPLPSAAVSPSGAPEKITLVPYGCTKFRVSMFPVTERAWKGLGGQNLAPPAP